MVNVTFDRNKQLFISFLNSRIMHIHKLMNTNNEASSIFLIHFQVFSCVYYNYYASIMNIFSRLRGQKVKVMWG